MHSSRSSTPSVSRRKVARPSLGSSSDQLGDRVGDAHPDRGDVVEVDTRDRLRRRRGRERGSQLLGGDAREQVGREPDEPLLEPRGARDTSEPRRR